MLYILPFTISGVFFGCYVILLIKILLKHRENPKFKMIRNASIFAVIVIGIYLPSNIHSIALGNEVEGGVATVSIVSFAIAASLTAIILSRLLIPREPKEK